MGQRLGGTLYKSEEDVPFFENKWTSLVDKNDSFPDLRLLPPEIGLKILSNVDAHELKLCRDIWEDLANDDLLWRRLCYINWGYCTAYKIPRSARGPHFWKSLYNTLESGTDSFNTYPTDYFGSGLSVLQSMSVLSDDAEDIAQFLFSTDLLRTSHVESLLLHRFDVLKSYVSKHDFTDFFLPIAMRSFFFKLSISAARHSAFIMRILDYFSEHYCHCNPSFTKNCVIVVTHSLVLLSNDLRNPFIRNKMSKREYIKNTLQAVAETEHIGVDSDYLGHAYDNVYLVGHVAPERLDGL